MRVRASMWGRAGAPVCEHVCGGVRVHPRVREHRECEWGCACVWAGVEG